MTVVDLAFPVHGGPVPRDHGYALYSALCGAVASFHEAPWLGIHPLSGMPVGKHVLALRPAARLLIRLPAERIVEALPLAGRTLQVASAKLSLGAPTVNVLVPAAALDARLVAIKLTAAPQHSNSELGRVTLDHEAFAQRYVAELGRQLQTLGIISAPELCGRRSITVAGKRIVGYSVRVQGLDIDQSLALQRHGLGGKRRMGCGMFRPTRGQ